jgi:hypothetical protein
MRTGLLTFAIASAALGAGAMAVPTAAQASVYCVTPTPCAGGTQRPSLDAALSAAQTHAGDDQVRLGPGIFVNSTPPSYNSPDAIDVLGAGSDRTTIRSSQQTVDGADLLHVQGNGGNTVEGLTFDMGSNVDEAFVGNADLFDITVSKSANNPLGGSGLTLLSGSVQDCDVSVGDAAAVSTGGSSGDPIEVTDCVLEGDYGVYANAPAAISRVIALADVVAVRATAGNTTVEDAEMDLTGGNEGIAVAAIPEGQRGDVTLSVNHATIVGDGDDTAFYSSRFTDYRSDLSVRNSAVLEGMQTARCWDADVADKPSLTVEYTAFDQGSFDGARCAGGGAFANARPAAVDTDFVDLGVGDLRLPATSALVDRGEPGPLSPDESPFDVLGEGRIYNGVRDLGAHEYRPETPKPPAKPPLGAAPALPAAPTRAGAPSVRGLRLTRRVFRAARHGTSRASRARTGTLIRYRLDAAARVKFTVERAAPGRKVGRSCRRRTRSNRHARRCTRYSRVPGSFGDAGSVGRNSLRFTGRMGGRKLRPGSYRLVAIGRASGKKGKPAYARFKIVTN